MELDYYLRALRRGWAWVLLATLVGAGLGAVYVAVTPKTYDAAARVVITANDPSNIPEAQSGAQLVSSMATTVAAMIASPVVLQPAADALDSDLTASQLASMLTVGTESSTGLVTLAVSAGSADEAADVATAVAEAASEIVPGQIGGTNSDGDELIRLDVLSTPEPPTSPTTPNTQGVMVIATLVGLTIGIALAISIHASDRRVRRARDLEPLATPVLAEIPIPAVKGEAALPMDEATSAAYQTLRTAIRADAENATSATLLVPLTEGVHDSTMAARLATAFARSGKRTLVVDLDGRGDALAAALGLEDSPGAFDVLAGSLTPEKATIETDEPRLWAMRAGAPEASPGDALAGPMLPALTQWAQKSFDAVVLHAPALLARPDAAIVAAQVGHVVIAVRSGRDDADQLRRGLDALHAGRATVLGAVLLQGGRRR